MAITKCKECQADISTTAEACPKCGAKQVPSPTLSSGFGKFILLVIGIIVALAAIGQYFAPSTPTNDSSSATSDDISNNDTLAAVEPQPTPQPGSQWQYEQESDPMTSSVTRYAQITSTNAVNFQSPYSGAQNATLVIREHPRHGKNIIMSIERGQILCHSYEDCNVLVRFDDQKPVTYAGAGPADNSTESLFIRNYSKFMTSLKKAKRVRISTEIYQEGSPVFEFDVSGFDEQKFHPVKK
ncbi:MAG: zinc ribbon domain-containing protein [Pseudomonadota bacterium]